MRKNYLGNKNTYSIIILIVVACLTSLGIQAAPPVFNAAVTITNDDMNPVPVSIADSISVRTSGVYRYVGTTSAVTEGLYGLNGMNDVCRTEFGNESRMCSTKEFFETPDTSNAPEGSSYIRPILVTSFFHPNFGSSGQQLHIEWAGDDVTGSWDFSATCEGYRNDPEDDEGLGATFLSVRDTGLQFATIVKGACGRVVPVTCCSSQ